MGMEQTLLDSEAVGIATDEQFDVVVIGAGFAGCAAAVELKRRGHSVKVLEAATRVGGRVFSFEHEGPDGQLHRFEHGAQFVGVLQTRIWALIEELMPDQLVDGYVARLPWRDQVMVLNDRRFVYDRDECLFGIGGVPPDLDLWDVLGAQLFIIQIQALERGVFAVMLYQACGLENHVSNLHERGGFLLRSRRKPNSKLRVTRRMLSPPP